MLNRILPRVVLACVVTSSVAYARPADQRLQSPLVKQAINEKVHVPGTSYDVDFPLLRSRQDVAILPQDLLKAIVTWLSMNFELPATDAFPAITLVSKAKLASFGHTGALSGRQQDATPNPPNQPELVAVYDASTKTIYLPEGWTGSTPAELSMLVHEMVHHLQRSSHLAYDCPQEREVVAYAAQEKWGLLFGRNVIIDLGLDPFHILLISACIFY